MTRWEQEHLDSAFDHREHRDGLLKARLVGPVVLKGLEHGWEKRNERKRARKRKSFFLSHFGTFKCLHYNRRMDSWICWFVVSVRLVNVQMMCVNRVNGVVMLCSHTPLHTAVLFLMPSLDSLIIGLGGGNAS